MYVWGCAAQAKKKQRPNNTLQPSQNTQAHNSTTASVSCGQAPHNIKSLCLSMLPGASDQSLPWLSADPA